MRDVGFIIVWGAGVCIDDDFDERAFRILKHKSFTAYIWQLTRE